MLLAKGADPEQVDGGKPGLTASYWAQREGNRDFLALNGVPEAEDFPVDELREQLAAENLVYSTLYGGGGGKKKGGKKGYKKVMKSMKK